jgi:radical SAM superfamily enzyme YgiQ (UPF0313 family)
MILFIHPPVVKPCEPPAGIGKLCGFLRREGIPVSVLDANLEGLLGLLENSAAAETNPEDRWTARARRSCSSHLDTLRDLPSYRRLSRYRRAVSDLERLLDRAAVNGAARPGLGNFRHPCLSPVRSGDLIRAAETPEENPFYSWFVKRIEGCLELEAPSFVGFSLNYLSQAITTFAMIGFLNRTCPGLTLILGGGLVTSWLSRPGWKNPFRGLVDHVIAGPGEGPLRDLLRPSVSPRLSTLTSTLSRQGRGLHDIPSPGGREHKGGGGDEHPDISPPLAGGDKGEGVIPAHVPPDYDGLPLHDYLSPGTILPYSASRGCWWRKCVFCPERAERNPYVSVPPERVISDLAALREKTSPVLIHLLDNAVSPALLEAMAKNPPGAPWYGFARITPHLTDPDFCRSLKRSGCVLLKLGLESGDQDVLDQLEKGIRLGEASRALKTLREAGISAYGYLLFGTPAENGESAPRALDFIVKHGDCVDFLNVAVFNLPVFAAPSLKLETRDFYEGDLSLYVDFSHPRGWNRQQVRMFLDREFRRHPAIAPILRRDPPVFTSNHAPFFTKDFPAPR